MINFCLFFSMENKPNSDHFHLPPGFRFHPSDEELIIHYLEKKISSRPLPASIIAELDLYKYNPWDLPNKALFGEDEWYFFTPRDRKYPNGGRPNRAAASGYWKATGTDKPIVTGCGTTSIGVKKALVFYEGRPPKGIKTDWIMHEFRLLQTKPWNLNKKGSMRLDDWVLCRVRQKNSLPKSTWEDQSDPTTEAVITYFPPKPVDEQRQSNEMVKTYLYNNEFPMLPYIFASQDLSSIDKTQLLYDDKNLNFNNNLFVNPLKIKQNMIKRDNNNSTDISAVTTSNNIGSDVNFGGAQQSEGSNFSSLQWNSLMQFQELDYFTFTGSCE